MGAPTTFTLPQSAMRTSVPSRRAISSSAGMCPFGGKATVSSGNGDTNVGQLSSLEERHNLRSVRCDFHHSDDDVVQVGERFNTFFWFELLEVPLQHRQERHAEQRRPRGVYSAGQRRSHHGVPLLHPSGAVDPTPFSRVHLEDYCWCNLSP